MKILLVALLTSQLAVADTVPDPAGLVAAAFAHAPIFEHADPGGYFVDVESTLEALGHEPTTPLSADLVSAVRRVAGDGPVSRMIPRRSIVCENAGGRQCRMLERRTVISIGDSDWAQDGSITVLVKVRTVDVETGLLVGFNLPVTLERRTGDAQRQVWVATGVGTMIVL